MVLSMDDIDEIEKSYLASISAASSLDDLEKIRVKGLGKKVKLPAL